MAVPRSVSLLLLLSSVCALGPVACSSTSVNEPGSGGGGGAGGATSGGSGGATSGGSGGATGTEGCADGTVEQGYGADMVGCNGATNQCDAVSLCSSGWHLCTYSQYVAHGGADAMATSPRWLEACIRNGPQVPHCPDDALCECVTGTATQPAPAMWECGGAESGTLDKPNVGVLTATSGSKLRPGCATAECSYADWGEAGVGISPGLSWGATCCRD